ncbi:TD and POZ domain-containing protein 4 [Microplitis demolitor]|uniref:TD and POZ domain-containing protein 4 n=1 Tax=Microplitis demolitor TaxID=69319 RepID=UPI000440003E|nr:TD and POZ domain-containing protein 4 [Microplitis demolitor]
MQVKKTIRSIPIKLIKKNEWAKSQYFPLKNVVPFLEFNVCAIINAENKLSIKVVKHNLKPATAVIELQVAKKDWMITDFKNWTEECCFDNVPIPSHYVNCDKCSRIYRANICKFCGYNLKVLCTITWYGFNDEYETADVSLDINKYLKPDRHLFSDVIVKVGDKKFRAHKIILAARSPVFEKTLSIDMRELKEDCMTLPDECIQVAEELMQFLYEGKLGSSKTNVDACILMLKIAKTYEINALEIVCEKILGNKVNMGNVVQLLEVAHVYNAPILKERVTSFILMNRAKVIPSSDYVDLSQRHPEIMTAIIKKLALVS